MIEINLLPDDLKPKTAPPAENAQLIKIIHFLPFIFAFLIVMHILLSAVFIFKNAQLAAVNSKWRKLEPQRKAVEELKRESDNASVNTGLSKQYGLTSINWAEKLNKISLDLPSGIWLNELSLSKKILTLRCSAVSLQKEEVALIDKFADNLKGDADFFKDFVNLELGPIERRVIAGYDIVDFILTLNLK